MQSSKLSYVASFLPPTHAALRAESRALQLLCRGPWNSIPPDLLKSVRKIGMPSQALDLQNLSLASRMRVAHVTFSFGMFIASKAHRMLGFTPSDRLIRNVISKYHYSSCKSYAFTFSHIRTISNQWCTRSRFGAKNRGCHFGCGHETDALKHSCICSAYWESFFRVARIPVFRISIEKVLIFSSDSVPISQVEFQSILIGLHICFLCFNSCRHGQVLSDRLIQHHLSHFMRKHGKAATMLLNIQQLSGGEGSIP